MFVNLFCFERLLTSITLSWLSPLQQAKRWKLESNITKFAQTLSCVAHISNFLLCSASPQTFSQRKKINSFPCWQINSKKNMVFIYILTHSHCFRDRVSLWFVFKCLNWENLKPETFICLQKIYVWLVFGSNVSCSAISRSW